MPTARLSATAFLLLPVCIAALDRVMFPLLPKCTPIIFLLSRTILAYTFLMGPWHEFFDALNKFPNENGVVAILGFLLIMAIINRLND